MVITLFQEVISRNNLLQMVFFAGIVEFNKPMSLCFGI